MQKISLIGGLLKKCYRLYSGKLLLQLQNNGHSDLRPSYLEVLLLVCEKEGRSIKEIGKSLGLKKQTMTSHFNELEEKGYIERRVNPLDKREQQVFLTSIGQNFKITLFESLKEIEIELKRSVGEDELESLELALTYFHDRFHSEIKETRALGRVHALEQIEAEGPYFI